MVIRFVLAVSAVCILQTNVGCRLWLEQGRHAQSRADTLTLWQRLFRRAFGAIFCRVTGGGRSVLGVSTWLVSAVWLFRLFWLLPSQDLPVANVFASKQQGLNS